MAITIPNAASTYTAAASIPNSANRWAWLGFVAAAGASGSVMWMAGNASTNGCPVLPIIAASGRNVGMQGPFNSPCGFYAASISTGCAIIWLKSAS